MSSCVWVNLPQRKAKQPCFVYFYRFDFVNMSPCVGRNLPQKNCNTVIFVYLYNFEFVKIFSSVGGVLPPKNCNTVFFVGFFKKASRWLWCHLVLVKIYPQGIVTQLFSVYLLGFSFLIMASCTFGEYSPHNCNSYICTYLAANF